MEAFDMGLMGEVRESYNFVLTRLTKLYGTLSHIENILNVHIDKVNNDIQNIPISEEIPFRYLEASTLTFHDITHFEDRCISSKSTEKQYVVTDSNFHYEMKLLLNREATYSVSQGLEAFATFLKDCAIITFLNNKELPASIKLLSKEEISNKFLDRSMRNVDYLEYLYKVYPKFKKALIENNSKRNYKDYINVLEFVRNKMTHSNNTFNAVDKQYIKIISHPIRLAIIKSLFPRKGNSDLIEIQVTPELGKRNLEIIASISFQLYKQIGIDQKDIIEVGQTHS